MLYLYQSFISLLGHLHFFLHFFFTFMENLFKKHPTTTRLLPLRLLQAITTTTTTVSLKGASWDNNDNFAKVTAAPPALSDDNNNDNDDNNDDDNDDENDDNEAALSLSILFLPEIRKFLGGTKCKCKCKPPFAPKNVQLRASAIVHLHTVYLKGAKQPSALSEQLRVLIQSILSRAKEYHIMSLKFLVNLKKKTNKIRFNI